VRVTFTKRASVAVALSSMLMTAMTACGGTVETESEQAASDIDPAITEAVKKEGLVRFWDNGALETSVQAYVLKEVVTAIGGETEIYEIEPGLGLPEMCRSDNLVTSDLWRWQNEEAWDRFVEKEKCIAEAGTTNYKGEEGWYVPTYVIEGDPERGIEPTCPELPDWKALNKCVEVLKTARSAPKGQFMTGAKSWQQWLRRSAAHREPGSELRDRVRRRRGGALRRDRQGLRARQALAGADVAPQLCDVQVRHDTC
jgi:glycine betaine/proline transport system substrate-binding protein